ncbi:hypothetical protein PbJCM13498_06740 [Prolixibacter bellariivorans]|uniref:Uncharacterized protein n=1 Tax=Prolixibacter bellariivorans TaxID=314319 RepID=A0A5M4AW59_9BACT|nr:MTH938/NDUFAF3 family protein [Prolixibacter bellariivorans]GET31811.1 hypothetical protein PbJCM13498_06740 [Prolixibacter bellariivorans]
MKPVIDYTEFGCISIDGQRYEHDVVIRLDGSVEKRKKNLSKEKYGTSHRVSLDEAHHLYEAGAERMIVGAGQYDQVTFSEDAIQYLSDQNCLLIVLPTPKAIKYWNKYDKPACGMFHTTC